MIRLRRSWPFILLAMSSAAPVSAQTYSMVECTDSRTVGDVHEVRTASYMVGNGRLRYLRSEITRELKFSEFDIEPGLEQIGEMRLKVGPSSSLFDGGKIKAAPGTRLTIVLLANNLFGKMSAVEQREVVTDAQGEADFSLFIGPDANDRLAGDVGVGAAVDGKMKAAFLFRDVGAAAGDDAWERQLRGRYDGTPFNQNRRYGSAFRNCVGE